MLKILNIKSLFIFFAVLVSLNVGAVKAEANLIVLEKQAEIFQSGLEMVQEGQLDKALSTWKTLAESKEMIPQLKRALNNNIAVILVKQKKYDEAKTFLNEALKADSQIATTINNLNKLYAYDAQKAYQKVFKKSQVLSPQTELLYFDIKRAEVPNKLVITDIADADDIKLVQQATEQWRKAWSNQDIEGYLAFYDDKQFLPKNGTSVEAWKRSRYPSVQGPKFIKVTTDDVLVTPVDDSVMRVSFYQRYHSDRFKDDIKKVLIWKKIDGQWKIIQEVVVYSDAK